MSLAWLSPRCLLCPLLVYEFQCCPANLQGIVHIVGPEQGFTLPGCTCVCGDSHTSTHGAFGALAFGIGTSEVRDG